MPTIDTVPLPESLTPGVSTGHIAHSVAVMRELYNAALYANTVNVMSTEYGAVDGGSAATNTTALNNARADIVATGKPGAIYIPAGVDLPVTPDAVLGGSDVAFFGGGKLSTTQTTVGALITMPAGTTGATVDGLVFESPNDAIVAVHILSEASSMSDDVAVINCECVNARLVLTNDDDPGILYADHSTDATTGNVTRNVTIRNNRGTRTGTNVTSFAFILLWYTVGAEVEGNRLDGYPYGIQWWGGDADTMVDGAVANERKAGNFTITNNKVFNCFAADGGGAGIWGSMGITVTVTGNTVVGCGDVGIDFEGCTDGTATGNTVKSCANGCLTTFFYNRNITFSANTVTQTNQSIIVRVMNNALDTDNKSVTFVGNTFTATTGISTVYFEPVGVGTFRANTCRNVVFYSRFNNQGATTVTENSFDYDVVAGAAMSAIKVGYNNVPNRVRIRGNEIRTSVSQPAGSRGIDALHENPVNPPRQWIEDNVVEGFADAIYSKWQGANAGIVMTDWLRNNTVDVGATITHDDAGAATPAVVIRAGNYYANGTAYP